MKFRYMFLAASLVILPALTTFGQSTGKVKPKTIIKKTDISNSMGKPVYESTADSLRTRVWILTQKKNKEMLKTATGKKLAKMKDKNMSMDLETRNAMMSGTHCLIFDVTNIKNGVEIADSSAKVEVVHPSRKTSSVKFKPMMNYFGSGVSLDEKGEYLFTINLNVGSGYQTTQFKYKNR